LAHNHAWLYGNDRNCPLCRGEVETEQHMLMTCPTLRVERALLQMSFEWYMRKLGEDNEQWLRRMITSAEIVEFAKVILRMRNVRRKMVVTMGYKLPPFLM
jgi:hypothetical protein